MADSIEPVDGVQPSHRVEVTDSSPRSEPLAHRQLSGEVTAVHRRAGHHDGEHILDESVGAQEYNEIVVRVNAKDVDDLVGKRVTLLIESD